MKNQLAKGIVFAILAGALWAVSGLFGQAFFQDYNGNAYWMSSVRLIFAGLILLAVSGFKADLFKKKSNWIVFLIYAFAGMFSVQFFFYPAIELSDAGLATILQYTAPVFVLIFTTIRRRKSPSLLAVLWVLLAMLGVFFLVTGGSVQHLRFSPIALVIGFLPALAVVVVSSVPRKLVADYGAFSVTGWAMIFAGLLSNVIHPLWRVDFRLSWQGLLLAAGITLVGTALAFWVAMKAVELVSPLTFAVATATEPLLSNVLSIFIFHQRLSLVSWISIPVIILAVIFLTKEEAKHA